MIDPLDDPEREAWRLRMRARTVAALTWSPQVSDKLFRRVLPCFAIVAVGLLIALHYQWIGEGWRRALDIITGLSSGLSGWWFAQTMKRRRSEGRPSVLNRLIFGPDP